MPRSLLERWFILATAIAGVLVLTVGQSPAPGQSEPSCCHAEVNLGFSEVLVRGGAPFEGIAGVGERCTAGEGVIVSGGPAGTARAKRVHVNIVSNLESGYVEGWSYGVALDGAAVVRAQTTAGTAADFLPPLGMGLRDPDCEFNKTQIIDPAKNRGQRGLVSAVARTCGAVRLRAFLPPVGTESLLAIDIAPEAPQGAEDQLAALRFQRGLVGAGQPVEIVVTVVHGQSASICNVSQARVDLVFRESGPSDLRRGDANSDARVDIADPIWILNGLFLSGAPSPCPDAADADDDGRETLSDAILLIGYIFASGIPPPAPGPEACGPDPSEDSLDCREVPATCP